MRAHTHVLTVGVHISSHVHCGRAGLLCIQQCAERKALIPRSTLQYCRCNARDCHVPVVHTTSPSASQETGAAFRLIGMFIKAVTPTANVTPVFMGSRAKCMQAVILEALGVAAESSAPSTCMRDASLWSPEKVWRGPCGSSWVVKHGQLHVHVDQNRDHRGAHLTKMNPNRLSHFILECRPSLWLGRSAFLPPSTRGSVLLP